jgi:lysozyme
MLALDYALALIKRWEGCHLTAYPDPGTGGAPWTIGWGSTGPGIGPGVTWTQQQADERLAADVQKFMTGVETAVGIPLETHQIGALTSLAYNIGLGAFRNSTLLRMIKAGDMKGASEQFLRWNRAGGRIMRGLSNRRADERDVFDGEDFSQVTSRVTSTEDPL